MFNNRIRPQYAFTLIELLIVIVVIAILAVLIIPKLASVNQRAKESSLRGNLHNLRTAVQMFYTDTGVYPVQLADLVATTAPATGYDDALHVVNIPAGTYHGPYISATGGLTSVPGMPPNPFSSAGVNGSVAQHWTYSLASPLVVSSAVSGTALDGTDYSTW